MRRTHSSSKVSARASGFTLIEVIVAIGIITVSVVTILALPPALAKSAEMTLDRRQAGALGDTIAAELARFRDVDVVTGQDRLEALASRIPGNDAGSALNLVAARDGLRVRLESEADASVGGLPQDDRYFLIELRQQPGGLAYVAGSGFLAVSATVRWPYQLVSSLGQSMRGDLRETSNVVLNLCIAE